MFYAFYYQVVHFYFSITTYNYLKIRKPHGLNIVKPSGRIRISDDKHRGQQCINQGLKHSLTIS